MVVIDEAYNEFLTPEQQYDAIAWVREFSNVIVSRSFSKAYGLAGLRIGYGIAQPQLTDLLNRIRQPFNVNSLAQAAAIAALADEAFLKKCYEVNRAGYQQLTRAFDQMGLEYLPSSGNFVLVKVGEEPNAGAVVNFTGVSLGDSSGQNRIGLTAPAAMHNGIFGGWATVTTDTIDEIGRAHV